MEKRKTTEEVYGCSKGGMQRVVVTEDDVRHRVRWRQMIKGSCKRKS